jgi:hypothetical protein
MGQEFDREAAVYTHQTMEETAGSRAWLIDVKLA